MNVIRGGPAGGPHQVERPGLAQPPAGSRSPHCRSPWTRRAPSPPSALNTARHGAGSSVSGWIPYENRSRLFWSALAGRLRRRVRFSSSTWAVPGAPEWNAPRWVPSRTPTPGACLHTSRRRTPRSRSPVCRWHADNNSRLSSCLGMSVSFTGCRCLSPARRAARRPAVGPGDLGLCRGGADW